MDRVGVGAGLIGPPQAQASFAFSGIPLYCGITIVERLAWVRALSTRISVVLLFEVTLPWANRICFSAVADTASLASCIDDGLNNAVLSSLTKINTRTNVMTTATVSKIGLIRGIVPAFPYAETAGLMRMRRFRGCRQPGYSGACERSQKRGQHVVAGHGCLQILLVVGTWALVAATLCLVYGQLSTSKQQPRLQLYLELRKDFDGALVAARKTLAHQLLDGTPHDDIKETVMNFFEGMGMLMRRGYLDREMIWGTFSFYVSNWWRAAGITSQKSVRGFVTTRCFLISKISRKRFQNRM